MPEVLCSRRRLLATSALYSGLASEFYDELRGIEAEPVGNVTVVSCHRDARLPADLADLSWIEAEPVGNVTVVSCHRDARLPADTADFSWFEQLECC